MVYPAEAFEPEATPAAVEAERCQDRQLQDPRFWRFVDEFPMIVTGKVQKFKMRETSVAELGLEGAAGTPTA